MRARADLRARPVSVVVLSVFLGVIGAGVIACLVGAARIESAYDRYRATYGPPDVAVFEAGFFGSGGVDLAEAGDLDMVEGWSTIELLEGQAFASNGDPLFFADDPDTNVVVVPDESPFGLKVIEGRMPRGADEVAVSWVGDEDKPAEVGDEIGVTLFNEAFIESFGDPAFEPPADAFIKSTPEVVGLVVPWFYSGGGSSDVFASEAFGRANPEAFSSSLAGYRLDNGVDDIEPFLRDVRAIDPDTFSVDASTEAEFARRSARFPALVSRIVALFLVITGLLIVGQTLVRRTALGGGDDPILRSLGMTRRQVMAGASVVPGLVGLAGTTLAVAGAYLVSSAFPFGLAGSYEPEPGRIFDAGRVLLWAAVVALVPIAVTAATAWRLSGASGGIGGIVEQPRSARPSRLAGAIARIRVPVPALVGTRMALETGHGRTATPVRSTMIALTLAVAAAVGGLIFAASMDHFIATPRLWGVDFEFATGFPFGEGVFEEVALPAILEEPGLADLTIGNFQQTASLTGSSGVPLEVNVWGLESVRGDGAFPTMTQGRWPASPDEIVIAAHTLDDLGVSVGETVTARVGDTAVDMTVVGVPVLPDFGFGPGLGEGAGLSMDALRRFYPESAWIELAIGNYTADASASEVLDRLNPTLSQIDAAVSEEDLARLGTSVQDASRYGRIPFYASLLFSVAALITLAHVLITSARVRRRDVAVLRTLGFRGRQVMGTVGWQASTLALVGFALGAPVGLVIGRAGWNLLAQAMGVIAVPVVPVGSVLLLAPVLVVVALLVAVGPAVSARRTKPAQVLRAE